nr:metallopeptidase family protein [Luteipulveratus mongoliensis]
MTMSDAEFDDLVGEALDHVPPQFLDRMDNVAILVEDESPPDGPTLLGLYQGTPLPERIGGYGYGTMPDRITIFRGPLKRMCRDAEHLRQQITVTVVHELGHHFGIDDDRLHELGWG